MPIDWTIVGIIIAALSLLIAYLQLRRTPKLDQEAEVENAQSVPKSKTKDIPSNHWHAITPPNTRYRIVTKNSNSLPAGVQTIALEYDPQGHAYPLNLKGVLVRTEIAFECQINNPVKAVTVGNEYALNFLPAHFLVQAREILESYTFRKLQENRKEIAGEITIKLRDHFNKYGFTLINVGIGAISKIEK